MNKKIVVMLTALLCVLSVIMVSIFGQIPNFDMNVLVEEITIDGYIDSTGVLQPCETNEKGEKFISLESIEPGETVIVLEWTVNPKNASNPDIYFNTDAKDGVISISDQGIISFYSTEFSKIRITILPKDGSPAYAMVTILRVMEEDPEINTGTMPI